MSSIRSILEKTLKRAYFNGSTDVIARQNGVIPNNTKLGEVQIEVLIDQAAKEIEEAIEVNNTLFKSALEYINFVNRFNETYKRVTTFGQEIIFENININTQEYTQKDHYGTSIKSTFDGYFHWLVAKGVI